MAYQKYTQCVAPHSYVPAPLAASAGLTLIALITTALGALAGVRAGIFIAIAADLALIGACAWYFVWTSYLPWRPNLF